MKYYIGVFPSHVDVAVYPVGDLEEVEGIALLHSPFSILSAKANKKLKTGSIIVLLRPDPIPEYPNNALGVSWTIIEPSRRFTVVDGQLLSIERTSIVVSDMQAIRRVFLKNMSDSMSWFGFWNSEMTIMDRLYLCASRNVEAKYAIGILEKLVAPWMHQFKDSMSFVYEAYHQRLIAFRKGEPLNGRQLSDQHRLADMLDSFTRQDSEEIAWERAFINTAKTIGYYCMDGNAQKLWTNTSDIFDNALWDRIMSLSYMTDIVKKVVSFNVLMRADGFCACTTACP